MKFVPEKFVPDKMGGNPKQYAILGGLAVLMLIVYLMNRDPSPQPAAAPQNKPSTPAPVAPRPGPRQIPQQLPQSTPFGSRQVRGGARGIDDFRPSLKTKEGVDISRIDPTLKLDLLAKLKNVELPGGPRNVFDFSTPPPPPPPKVDAIKPGGLIATAKPQMPVPTAPVTSPKPPAPPIPLKFYGYAKGASADGKRAFFLDGDEIQIKGENDVIRGRYKIIRIGVNSAVVEDLTNHNQQTLPLVEEMNG